MERVKRTSFIFILSTFLMLFIPYCAGRKQAIKEETKPQVIHKVKPTQPMIPLMKLRPDMGTVLTHWISRNQFWKTSLDSSYFLVYTRDSMKTMHSINKQVKKEVTRIIGINSDSISLDTNLLVIEGKEKYHGFYFYLVRYPFAGIEMLRREHFKDDGSLIRSYLQSFRYYQYKSPVISLYAALNILYLINDQNEKDTLKSYLMSNIRSSFNLVKLQAQMINRNFNRYTFRVKATEGEKDYPVSGLPLKLFPENHFYATALNRIKTGIDGSCEVWFNLLPGKLPRPIAVSINLQDMLTTRIDTAGVKKLWEQIRDIAPRANLEVELPAEVTLSRADLLSTGTSPEDSTIKGKPEPPSPETKEAPELSTEAGDTTQVLQDTLIAHQIEEVEKETVEKTTTEVAPEKEEVKESKPTDVSVIPPGGKDQLEKSEIMTSAPPEAGQKPSTSTPIVSMPAKKGEIFRPGYKQILLDDIFFDSNKFIEPSRVLSKNYFITLSKVVKLLKNQPDIIIRLVGHTDQTGDKDFNKWISLRRAITVGQLIVELFPEDEKQGVMDRIEVKGVGGEDPLITGNTRLKTILNRRVSIEIDDHFEDGIPLPQAIENVPVRYIPPEKKPEPQALANLKKSPEKGASSTSTAFSPEKIVDDKSIYRKGYEAFLKKEYRTARTYFESIITQKPESIYADNAQYWIGEILYAQKKYPEALIAFSEVERYGDKNKVPYAVLRMGYCYLKLGNKEKALDMFTRILEQYPGAREERRKAIKMINTLSGPGK